ncbi:hypothetical protein [Subtercola endophyticus]|uniref:hypothetical protein n=1 Tax=Subtercola endophyticus TaxID=2895559 RepID=UPI001E65D7AA|nr:hypothetical protein [Subtercola endophyticus]UFS60807.1 hypothetical protein LQ955_08760 [Subtercola endophyticus]
MITRLRRGGFALLAASLLLILATAAEAPLLTDPADRGAAFWLYLASFALAAVGYVAAGVLLARGGLIGTSVLGRVGLIGFGVLWFVGQVLYVVGTYVSASDAMVAVSTVVVLVGMIGALLGGIEAIRAGVMCGFARWSLLCAVIVSIVAGGIAGASTDVVVTTVLHIVSAASLALAGVSFVVTHTERRAVTPARG